MIKAEVNVEGKVFPVEFKKAWQLAWFIWTLNYVIRFLYWWYGIDWTDSHSDLDGYS
jgi:hypothetical protein